MSTVYYVGETQDPCGSFIRMIDLDAAKKIAASVGHFHICEYSVRPGIPGIRPDEETLAANIYDTTDRGWVRDTDGVSE